MKRHSTCDFRHVLFAEDPDIFNNRYTKSQDNLIVKPLGEIAKWRGCMPKLEAFKDDPDLQGQVFVFDLDNVITGNIDELLAYRGEFAICMDPLPARRNLIGGNISSYPAGSLKEIHRMVAADYSRHEQICGGSERFLLDHMREAGVLTHCDFLQDLFPGMIRSLKFDVVPNALRPVDMRILWTHGRPRPHKLWRKGYAEYHRIWNGNLQTPRAD